MNKQAIRMLYQYNRWANARILGASCGRQWHTIAQLVEMSLWYNRAQAPTAGESYVDSRA